MRRKEEEKKEDRRRRRKEEKRGRGKRRSSAGGSGEKKQEDVEKEEKNRKSRRRRSRRRKSHMCYTFILICCSKWSSETFLRVLVFQECQPFTHFCFQITECRYFRELHIAETKFRYLLTHTDLHELLCQQKSHISPIYLPFPCSEAHFSQVFSYGGPHIFCQKYTFLTMIFTHSYLRGLAFLVSKNRYFLFHLFLSFIERN